MDGNENLEVRIENVEFRVALKDECGIHRRIDGSQCDRIDGDFGSFDRELFECGDLPGSCWVVALVSAFALPEM